MKKGQILEGYIERVDFPNKGFAVVEDEEKKVIVKNTVPEQKVRFAVNKIRKGQAEGRLLEILEHSPEECQPACPHPVGSDDYHPQVAAKCVAHCVSGRKVGG